MSYTHFITCPDCGRKVRAGWAAKRCRACAAKHNAAYYLKYDKELRADTRRRRLEEARETAQKFGVLAAMDKFRTCDLVAAGVLIRVRNVLIAAYGYRTKVQ